MTQCPPFRRTAPGSGSHGISSDAAERSLSKDAATPHLRISVGRPDQNNKLMAALRDAIAPAAQG